MPYDTLTPRERWLAVLNRQKPDRVPRDYWSTPEFSARLIRHMGLSRLSEKRLAAELDRPARDPQHPNRARSALNEALRRLNVDFVIHVGPNYIGPKLPANTDMFGCTYRSVNYGTGEY